MTELKYIMHCGCFLPLSELITIDSLFVCPIHKARVNQVQKICQRCGRTMITSYAGHRKACCPECDRTIDQARTICNFHELSDLIDPILLRKSVEDVLQDIFTNVLVGYEAIQIDAPRKSQHENKKITIDFNTKIACLKSLSHKEVNMPVYQAIQRDCRTCVKLNACERAQECSSNNQFTFWQPVPVKLKEPQSIPVAA